MKPNAKPARNPFGKIVAELSALALSKLVGRDTRDYFGNSYRYIADYADKLKMEPHSACMKVIWKTEKVITLILGKN